MVHLQVELDGLQQDPLDDHDLLARVQAEGGELPVVGQLPHRADKVLALLGGLLGLASQEQAAGGHNLEEYVNIESINGTNGVCSTLVTILTYLGKSRNEWNM